MSLPSPFPSPPRKSCSSHAIRFERISPINFISQFMQRPRHGSVYKWKRGRWTREEYGSTWLFRARSDRSSPHFPTNSAPATKGKGRRSSRGGGWENSSRRTTYWYHIYWKIGSSLDMVPSSIWLPSRDEQW